MSDTALTAIDPSIAQRQAADPQVSAWVSASAGSGKTKVLTDRVLSLLLAGTRPERILCITFTKAAAAEMANRINGVLGGWATADDAALDQALAVLLGRMPERAEMVRARRLFAHVLDAPGGLSIQTVHSFCQSLLGRFPVEAEVPPHFDVMDERSAGELMAEARDEVLREAGTEGVLADAIARVSAEVQEDRFAALLQALAGERGRLRRLFDLHGGDMARLADAIHAALGSDPGWSESGLMEAAVADEAFDVIGLRLTVESLTRHGSAPEQDKANVLARWLASGAAERRAAYPSWRSVFLTDKGEIRKRPPTKKVLAADPHAEQVLANEAERLVVLEARLAAVSAAEATTALLSIGRAMLDAYARLKRQRAKLDYDDLILKARELLQAAPDRAAWVLYKLDGGIEHILVDEAQDTNPDQWAVIGTLAQEFFSGRGQHDDRPRTVFAVGDAKQSIYSFQRADPRAFAEMRELFRSRSEAAGMEWRQVPLTVSFRSTDAVLRAVDAVFARAPARDGVVEPGLVLEHLPFRRNQAGRVELWPLSVELPGEEAEPWQPVIEPKGSVSSAARLAEGLADSIAGWIGTPALPAREQPLRAQDVMVLVRHRTGFVDLLVKALKARGVPVAGVDRMILSDQLAVMDLIALAQALLLPQDDLILATVLKGPFCGLGDDDLMALAWDRGRETLWRQLNDRAGERPEWRAALDWLQALRRRVDFLRPFELFSALLEEGCPGAAALPGGVPGWTGRQTLIARLGSEVEDPLEEFLSLALAFERLHPPAMQRFLSWFVAGSSEIKRDLEAQARDEVRIMTVHGAKGLQAPLVILADTVSKPGGGLDLPLFWKDELVLWGPGRGGAATVIQELKEAAKQAREEEYRRLLYVAMTRAEDRLVIVGNQGARQAAADCWYNMALDALAPLMQPEPFPQAGEGWAGTELLAMQTTQRADPDRKAEALAVEAVDPGVEAPGWLLNPPQAEPTPSRPLAPSRPKLGEPAVRSPLARGDKDRFRRGLLAHRLLQLLPALPVAGREQAGRAFLARPVHGLAEGEAAELLAEVMGVLDAPALAPLFGPDSLAEAPIVGLGPEGRAISGQVDRLAITDDGIWLADYKTLRPVPSSAEAVPPAYLAQMAGYRALLRDLYPERSIRISLIFTDGPKVIDLDEALLDRSGSAP